MIEVKTGDDVKVIDGYRVYQFNWFDSELSTEHKTLQHSIKDHRGSNH